MSDVSVATVRASKDGHQFHEAWVARRALGLILPRDGLCGIAVEGLSRDLEDGADAAVLEIADATLFFGRHPTFDDASRIEIAQFKYSIAKAEVGIRAFNLKKTLGKFARAEEGFIAKYGEQATWERFRYTFVTNQPISEGLKRALAAGGVDSATLSGEVKEQHEQLLRALNLPPGLLGKFFSRLYCPGRH